MPTDVLTLGGVTFDDFSTPERMMAGGAQMLVIHKLPGGSRVIDTLGPDEANITWRGEFFGDANAYSNALALDAMRAEGLVQQLTFGGQSRSVIVDTFIYEIRRFPSWVAYQISCTVYQNPQQGNLTATFGTIDSLVVSDFASAAGAAGL